MKRLKQLSMVAFLFLFLMLFSFTTIDETYGPAPLTPPHTRKGHVVSQEEYGSLFPIHRAQGDIQPGLPTRTANAGKMAHRSVKARMAARHRRQRHRRQRKKRAGHRELEELDKAQEVAQQLRRGTVSEKMLSTRLRNEILKYVIANDHRVAFTGHRVPTTSKCDLLCQLKRQTVRWTLDGKEPPFSSHGWDKLVPQRTPEELYGPGLRTCAVVSSAGAILNSSLGKEIDSHEAVLRFNAAPTEGFENDVGTKTTFRIINSQIVANPRHNFNSNDLYRNVTLLAWDPAPYNGDLLKWYQDPDYDLFTAYKERRRLDPNQPFYILHPSYIWRLWDVIQGNTLEDIQPNPPSSGFIGITVMLALCETVDVYEYIPSQRQTDLCHYYENYEDDACTLGAYHPLLYEKALIRRLSDTSEDAIRVKGRLTLPGFRSIHKTGCGCGYQTQIQ